MEYKVHQLNQNDVLSTKCCPFFPCLPMNRSYQQHGFARLRLSSCAQLVDQKKEEPTGGGRFPQGPSRLHGAEKSCTETRGQSCRDSKTRTKSQRPSRSSPCILGQRFFSHRIALQPQRNPGTQRSLHPWPQRQQHVHLDTYLAARVWNREVGPPPQMPISPRRTQRNPSQNGTVPPPRRRRRRCITNTSTSALVLSPPSIPRYLPKYFMPLIERSFLIHTSPLKNPLAQKQTPAANKKKTPKQTHCQQIQQNQKYIKKNNATLPLALTSEVPFDYSAEPTSKFGNPTTPQLNYRILSPLHSNKKQPSPSAKIPQSSQTDTCVSPPVPQTDIFVSQTSSSRP